MTFLHVKKAFDHQSLGIFLVVVLLLLLRQSCQAMMVQAIINPITLQAEADGSLSTERVSGQLELRRETVNPKQNEMK